MRPIIAWSLVALALVGAFGIRRRLEAERPTGARRHILYVPDGDYLKYASLGHQHLVADILYLWAIQYASDRSIRGQEAYLPRVFDVITDLDSRYRSAYLIGAYVLATDFHANDAALALLDKGARETGDYFYSYDAGYYCFLYLKDYPRAERYFRRASARPDCPVYVRRLALKMAALERPSEAYRLYVAELEGFLRANTPARIGADTQLGRHVRLMRRRIEELETSIECAALQSLLSRVTESDGHAPDSFAMLVTRIRRLGLSVEQLGPDNDPWRDPRGRPYELRDGRVVTPVEDLRRRAPSSGTGLE